MSATSHEAPYVLDGLLHHAQLLQIGTHYTDTGGASDHVFILCTMLGIRFCPRLHDFPDRKLACIEPASTYKDLQPLLAGACARTSSASIGTRCCAWLPH
jgi:TnpA family transposase